MWEVSPRTLSSYCIPWRACCASGTHFTHVFSQGLLPGRQADSGQHPQWMLTNGGGAGPEEQGRGQRTKRRKSTWGAGEPAMAKEVPEDDKKHARGPGEEDGKEKRDRQKGACPDFRNQDWPLCHALLPGVAMTTTLRMRHSMHPDTCSPQGTGLISMFLVLLRPGTAKGRPRCLWSCKSSTQ